MYYKMMILFFSILLLSGCDYSKKENQTGIFYHLFVQPMDRLLHGFGHLFHNNYGLAIIAIVLLVRLILLPFMLIQVKHIHMMREKTKIVKPQIDYIQKRIKEAETQEEKQAANQLLMKKYNQYGINPFKNLIGCLPIIIQIPILMGLFMSLKYPSTGGINQYPHVLWFNLTHPDIVITVIAAILYFIQPLVNAIHYPKEQRKTYYVMMILSPIFITYVSLSSASALALYWSVSAAFLIVQMHFAHQHYAKVAKHEAQQLEQNLSNETSD